MTQVILFNMHNAKEVRGLINTPSENRIPQYIVIKSSYNTLPTTL